MCIEANRQPDKDIDYLCRSLAVSLDHWTEFLDIHRTYLPARLSTPLELSYSQLNNPVCYKEVKMSSRPLKNEPRPCEVFDFDLGTRGPPPTFVSFPRRETGTEEVSESHRKLRTLMMKIFHDVTGTFLDQ